MHAQTVGKNKAWVAKKVFIPALVDASLLAHNRHMY